jgi:hypothetical protein
MWISFLCHKLVRYVYSKRNAQQIWDTVVGSNYMSWMAKGNAVQFLAGSHSLDVKWPRDEAKRLTSPPFTTEVRNQ